MLFISLSRRELTFIKLYLLFWNLAFSVYWEYLSNFFSSHCSLHTLKFLVFGFFFFRWLFLLFSWCNWTLVLHSKLCQVILVLQTRFKKLWRSNLDLTVIWRHNYKTFFLYINPNWNSKVLVNSYLYMTETMWKTIASKREKRTSYCHELMCHGMWPVR